MSTPGSIFLACGWVIVAFNPAKAWVSLVLFGLALFSFVPQLAEGRYDHYRD